jgi:phospholipase/lecithinase/hemolysin
MKKGSLSKSLIVGVASVLFAAPTFVLGQGVIPSLAVFGDSLSDPGNLFALTQDNNVPPSYDVDAVLVPNSAYAEGGHHLSNGPTWVEDLARSRAISRYADAAWRAGASPAANYAVAGARARDAGAPIPSFSVQVERFLQNGAGGAAPDTLYVVGFGGNDIRDALLSGDTSAIDLAVEAISANIGILYQAGARRFVVLNSANIGLIPSVRAFGPAASSFAELLTQQFNTALGNALANLSSQYSDIQILQFDLYSAIASVHGNPSAFGLAEVDAPCITPDVAPYKCTDPDQYLFWDGVHPTRAVHAIVAQQIGQALAQ